MRKTPPYLVTSLAVSAVLLASCGTDSASDSTRSASPSFAPAVDTACATDTAQSTSGKNGFAVATTHPQAAWAACTVLAQGGSAADAVAAAQLALGVVEPMSSGPGGGALAVYYDAHTRSLSSYDGTVVAPKDETGDALSSAGVPHTLALLASLRADYGVLDASSIAEPARDLASDGFTVSERFADAAASDGSPLTDTGLAEKLYGAEGADGITAGETLTNRAYADFLGSWVDTDGALSKDTIESLANELPDVAGRANFAREWHDAAAAEVDPLCVTFQDTEVCGVGSPATGTPIVAQTLGILNHLDPARHEPYDNDGLRVARTTAAHEIIEAERIAFANANTWAGDPAGDKAQEAIADGYINDIVTDRRTLKDEAKSIRKKRPLKEPEAERLDGVAGKYRDFEEEGTAQISVRDGEGSFASVTTTLQKNFGTGLTAGGFFINNSLDNFGSDDQREPNARAPRRHPKTTMSPLIITDNGGDAVAALGSPGGKSIPSYNIKTTVALTAWGLAPDQAVTMPNFGATGRHSAYVETPKHEDLPRDMKRMRKVLERWGHSLDTGEADSGTSVVTFIDGTVAAAADPRRGGGAAASSAP